MLHSLSSFICALAFFLITPNAFAANWLQFGKDFSNSRNQSEETRIHSGNVSGLELKWSFQTKNPLFKTPAVEEGEDGFLYFADLPFFPTQDNSSYIYKLNKQGQAIWSRSIKGVLGECLALADIPDFHVVTAPALRGNKLIVGTYPFWAHGFPTPQGVGGYLIAMNKETGVCETATAVTDPNHPFEGILGSITVHGNVAYMGISSYEEDAASAPGHVCCSTIGKVAAVNVQNGKLLWVANMIDPLGDPSTGSDDRSPADLAGYSGATVWGSAPAVYPRAGLVIVNTGNAYSRGTVTPPEELNAFHLSINAFVGLDMESGRKVWVTSVIPDDFWNTSCVPFFGENEENCPEDEGPDWDFGANCSMVKLSGGRDACVAINKEGSLHAVDARSGEHLWQTKIGPSSLLGLAGTCYDGETLYATQVNAFDEVDPGETALEWTLVGGPNAGEKIYGGSLSAVNPATGEILWQNADPLSFEPGVFGVFSKAPYLAPPTCTGDAGVVFASSTVPNEFLLLFGAPPSFMEAAPNMFGFDAATGEILYDFQTAAPVISGPAVVDGRVYWGDGMALTPGTLYTFGLPE